MPKCSILKTLQFALGCATLVFITSPAKAENIRVNAGTTWTLAPTTNPNVFTHTVDGITQVSLLGTCTFHGDVLARFPAAAGQPIALTGSFTFTTADGVTTLRAAVEGTGTPDSANPGFLNFQYQVQFSGGSGSFAAARGEAEINGAAMFTSASAGTATWTMKGHVITPRPNP
jgi:hypothetical protein